MGGRDCIAIQFLYCNLVGLKLYCNTLLCIVTGSGAKVRLYRDTAERARSRALRHGAGRCDTAWRGTRHWRAARALGARPGRAAGLCAFSLFLTRFDSVLFLSQFLDIVREPGS